jgi:hypothetical protein
MMASDLPCLIFLDYIAFFASVKIARKEFNFLDLFTRIFSRRERTLGNPSTAIQKYYNVGWVERQRNPTFRECLMLQN